MAAAPHALAVAAGTAGLAAVMESVCSLWGPAWSGTTAVLFAVLALATTLPLAVLGPAGAASAIAVANLVAFTAFDEPTVAGAAALLAGLYRLGRQGPPAPAPLLVTVLGAPFLVAGITAGVMAELEVATLLAAVAPTAGWIGIAHRAGREAQAQRAERQEIAGDLLEHTARGERARIARELHDVVAHHISMVAVQAETARLTTPGMPPAGAQRLSAIGDTARSALTEMRRLLGVLREDAPVETVERHPQPGLQELTELLDAARDASGSGTRLIVRGPVAPLDPGVELAAYRIVQEALTNARRHAPGAATDVELHFEPQALRVRIRDNGPGPASGPGLSAGGHGLTGMRERAAAVGGRLVTGPSTVGGFLVEARLPVPDEAIE
jgi:signal transduction histidine kinase